MTPRKPRAKKRKNPAAVALGRKGGQAYARRSPEERREAASKASKARWEAEKQRRAPDPLAERSA